MTDTVTTEIDFTDSAAKQVAELIQDEGNPNLKLRVSISGGGCSGFQYVFSFDENQDSEEDFTYENQGVALLIDSISHDYLLGAKIDYIDDLQGARFVITNPNASGQCGCGSSFSVD